MRQRENCCAPIHSSGTVPSPKARVNSAPFCGDADNNATPNTMYSGPQGSSGVNRPIVPAAPWAENFPVRNFVRAVRRTSHAGRGMILSMPNASINIPTTRAQGSSAAGESKNHRKGCWPKSQSLDEINSPGEMYCSSKNEPVAWEQQVPNGSGLLVFDCASR